MQTETTKPEQAAATPAGDSAADGKATAKKRNRTRNNKAGKQTEGEPVSADAPTDQKPSTDEPAKQTAEDGENASPQKKRNRNRGK